TRRRCTSWGPPPGPGSERAQGPRPAPPRARKSRQNRPTGHMADCPTGTFLGYSQDFLLGTTQDASLHVRSAGTGTVSAVAVLATPRAHRIRPTEPVPPHPCPPARSVVCSA